MTTSAAVNAAAHADKEKPADKAEKRRALGRGLESLLPGPRVVPRAAVPPAPGQSGAAAGAQQIPHSVRNDKGDALDGSIQAVAEHAAADAADLRSAGQPGAAVPTCFSPRRT